MEGRELMPFFLKTQVYNGRESAELCFENVFHKLFDVEELVLLFYVTLHLQNTHMLFVFYFSTLYFLFFL